MGQNFIGVGLISYGYIGKVHSLCYQEMPFYYNLNKPVKLVGVTSPSHSSREKALREAKYEFSSENPEDLLKRTEIDLIDICSPTYLHEKYIIMAAEHKKAIYIEKPLGHTLESARRAYSAASKNGLHTGMAFEYRFVPALLKAKELLQEGVIGSIINFRIIYQGSEHLSIRKDGWQLDKNKAGGGVLFALGSHMIDLIRFLIGEFDSVFSIKKNLSEKGNVEQLILIQARMHNGVLGTLEASQVAAGSCIDLRLEVFGTKGTICFDNRNPNILKLYESNNKYNAFQEIQTMQQLPEAIFPPSRVDVNWLRYHLTAQYHFMKGLNGESDPISPTIEDGMKCQEVMEAVMLSWNKKNWVEMIEI
ncbi:MAG: Gfo/Idh/MocA family protein [bacterium]